MRDYGSVAKSLRCCISDSEPCEYCNCELEECTPKTIMEIAADAIEELQAAVPKWVSVDERLPEKWEWVLTCYEGGIGLQFIMSDGTWYSDSGVEKQKPCFWMPLPTTWSVEQ